MKIPDDAKVAHDERLTVIRAAKVLHDRACGEGGLITKVKATMEAKGVMYAESELVNARLQPMTRRGPIDPRQLYKLVQGGKLKLEQFLDVVTVRKEPLAKHLPGETIDALCGPVEVASPSLITEYKSGTTLESREVAQQCVDYWP